MSYQIFGEHYDSRNLAQRNIIKHHRNYSHNMPYVVLFCTAFVFIKNPLKYGKNYSVQPVDNAGKTEIRVYYGAISAALGIFLGFLAFACARPFYALCGGLFFANAVFWTRLVFTFVDKGWKCPLHKACNPRRRPIHHRPLDLLPLQWQLKAVE